jgi:periplasmic protein TonB
MDPRAAVARPSLMGELFDRSPKRRSLAVFAWVLALAGHSLAATFALGATGPRPRSAEPVDLEFVEPDPPPPEPLPPPPPPAEEAPKPERDTPIRSVPTARAEPPPPAPAAAGALLTAKEDPDQPKATEELVDFASDPNSRVYGGGVVAVGGTGTLGGRGTTPRAVAAAPTRTVPPPPAPRPKDELTPVADLSQKPRLDESDPCRGFFPQSAVDDTAQVGVMVVVAKTGSVGQATVVLETPSGQGFGNAARACMLSKRFTPALDRSGNPARTAVRVNVRFRR